MELQERINILKQGAEIAQKNGALTLEEAVAYSGIGRDKLCKLSNREDCDFILWIGRKRLFKRKKLDEYIEKSVSI